jgi:hypothetical protein
MNNKKLAIGEIRNYLNTTVPNDCDSEQFHALMLICGELIDELEDYRAALEKLKYLEPQMKKVQSPCPDGIKHCAVFHYTKELDLDPGLIAREVLEKYKK